jgi:hypothetical protein
MYLGRRHCHNSDTHSAEKLVPERGKHLHMAQIEKDGNGSGNTQQLSRAEDACLF